MMTASNMLALGNKAVDFALPDTEGNTVTLSDFKQAKGLVVAFICNHCPYVIHIAPALAKVAKEYQHKGIGFVAINSNDIVQYPADDMQNMVKEKHTRNYPFPYLLDESQAVAKAYAAACTPDFYLFNGQHELVYRGQFDASRPTRISSGNYDSSQHASTGADLCKAMDSLLAGETISEQQQPSMGCNIKWKSGNEPE